MDPSDGHPPLSPPKLARALVRWRLTVRQHEVLDDLDTLFARRVTSEGVRKARWRYTYEALNIGLFGIGESANHPYSLTGLVMYKNYLKIALRTLLKHKGYSSINIVGLGVGIACCILILLYVGHEFSYDRFHEHGDDLYRIQMDRFEGHEKIFSSAVTFPMVGPTLHAEVPEVIGYARLLPMGGVIQYDALQFREDNIFSADSTFLTLLSYPLLQGEAKTVLTEPYTAIVSASTARRYFGEADPVGKVLRINGDAEYTVTGVFADVPVNSHLDFDLLFSFSTLANRSPASQTSWGWYDFYTYVRLAPGADPAVLEAKMKDFMARHKAESYAESARWETLLLQPVHDIHLYSRLSWEAGVNGNGTTVYFLLVIALFILVIAWVNFINLSTARSMERALEVGVRKALGAPRAQLVRQFLLESLLVNVMAAMLALGLVWLLLPTFANLAGLETGLRLSDNPDVLGWVFGVFLAGAFLSGLYPAFFLSSFKPMRVLKGGTMTAGSGLRLRKSLVVFQFAASIVLIAGTLIVVRQLDYLQNQDLGLNIDQTLVVRGPNVLADREAYPGQIAAFRDEVLKHPNVRAMAASSTVPGVENFRISGFRTERMAETERKDMYIVGVDDTFMDLFEIEVLAGRLFSQDFGTDEEAFVLNETATRLLGFETPEAALQSRIARGDEFWPIIGVIADYHQNSLKENLDPVLFRYIPRVRSFYSLKIAPQNADRTIAAVEAAWKAVFPGNPYEYFFLDDFFDEQYQADRQFGQVFGLFALLAILVACLGLFGLTAFSVQQRTKEIGIRKVLGATAPGIAGLLSKEYAILVVLANGIAWPVTYGVMQRWLDTFAYHIDPGFVTLLLAGLATLLIAGLTVSYHTLRAAHTNPVDALRYE